MSMPDSELWGWAKTNRRHPGDPLFAWLSYLDHGLDVATVFRALAAGPYRGLVRALFGGDDDALLDQLASLAGLHDLGKASWTFQGMEIGPTPQGNFSRIHHAEEACALLLEIHRASLPALAYALCPVVEIAKLDDRALLRSVFSHHGLPRNGRIWESQMDLTARMRPLVAGGPDPLFLVRQLAEALPGQPGINPLEGLDPTQRNAALHGLMGLVNLADWIGSSAAWFPLRPERPGTFDRWWAAQRALTEIGWPLLGLSHASDDEAIRQVLACYTSGRVRTLRPVQAHLVAAIQAAPPAPGDVLVLEEETGGGKTLAAYLIHALLARRGLCTGLTFCLPTRASARAIHEGAERVYGARTTPVLAVGGYELAAVLPGLSDRPATGNLNGLGKSDLNWAARSRHRFLAAPVAVGTVDQVLLGALTVKYAHVRQVAPACNLLVVDEVHASDPYMRGLLREIVQRRRATGGITLLMSATLGADLRSELLAPAVAPAAAVAGRRMLGGSRRVPQAREQDAASIIGEAVPYPILWLGPDNPVRLTDGPPVAKTVTILPCVDWPEDAVGDVAQKAIAAARAGARVLVIRNTVRLARATATAVSAIEPTMLLHLNNHPICHHARFAAQDRLALDGVLMAALNPDPAKRRGGLVAVTTQTAEQSLDVDADLLITDMVPADVLLQRIGRLHRNRSPEAFEARPAGFAEPRCIVLAPAESAALLAFASAPGRGPNAWGTDRAYADTLTLSATREMIGTGATWRIPEDNRRIVEGAISKAARHALAERSGAMGDEAERRVSARTMFQDERRREVSWSFHDNPDDSRFCERGLFETRADGMAATRLGLDDCRLELDPPFPSPFGSWMIGAVTVPGWLALALKLPGDSRATWRSSAEGVEITVEGHGARFSYGEFGLAPLEGGKSP